MNRTRLGAVLLVSGILFVGCDGDPGRVASPTAPGGRSARPSSVDLDSLQYEVFSGTLYPGQSGAMYKNLKSWQAPNCLFSLVVPASSMPDQGPPINFTMSIPTKASYDEDPTLFQRLIIRLAPDGEQFLGPITIQGTWMPWQGAPPNPLWYYSGPDSGLATVTYLPSIQRYRVTFQVNHFSDWEVGPEPRRTTP